ncbi:MAG TPA: ABC transporter substrate-binding protein, partial [Gemmatimonadales bacterium]
MTVPLRRLLFALFVAGCRAPEEPVRLGLAGPFGDAVGRPMRLAALLAVEEINAAGGIEGRSVELVAADDFGDPDSAVVVAARLVSQGVTAVVGHVYSGTTLAAAPVYGAGPDP